ncbi:DUF4870 domain-containing protein [Bacillus sp. AFS041924]|uniref:DUF4870 domain-containing protein n=1 Tax=Bacillus sp. AFS041924 TaxID=2033503 RepID=UPI000BFC8FCE|nr:DUF4870 domain-containing protein [Bacillus sp. AFS041924]PGS55433.1 hypothetical protein COC46_03335 [Bacillus sp. AFS041924]
MEANKILSSLCYFSVFFAPFLFPIIVYFVAKDQQLKSHSKRAFFSHILPFLTIIILALISLFTFNTFGDGASFAIIGGFILAFIVNLIVFIWNIVQGIKVLIG